jgi:two-component system cell cycle response regulator
MPARILVADDNAPNLELMLYLLRACGHEVHGVADGLAAWAATRDQHYDLILTDVLMPGIDGYEFARRLSADQRRVPLIAVTALAMVGDRDRLLASGFDGYVAKPIEPPAFIAYVEAYLPESLRSRGVRGNDSGR